MNLSRPHHWHDQWIQHDRNKQLHASWDAQTPALTSAYIQHKCDVDMDLDASSVGGHTFHVIILGIWGKLWPVTFCIIIYPSDSEYNYQMQIAQNENKEANIAFICHGYLGASPSQPTIAFTLEALEFHHQLHCHQANFSVQAFIKVLCAIHNVCQTFNSI